MKLCSINKLVEGSIVFVKRYGAARFKSIIESRGMMLVVVELNGVETTVTPNQIIGVGKEN